MIKESDVEFLSASEEQQVCILQAPDSPIITDRHPPPRKILNKFLPPGGGSNFEQIEGALENNSKTLMLFNKDHPKIQKNGREREKKVPIAASHHSKNPAGDIFSSMNININSNNKNHHNNNNANNKDPAFMSAGIQLTPLVSSSIDKTRQRASLDKLPVLTKSLRRVGRSATASFDDEKKTLGGSAAINVSIMTPIQLGSGDFASITPFPKLNRQIMALNNPVVRIPRRYRYRYIPGNNGRVILQAFRRRPW